MTINELLVCMKIVRERLSDLKGLRSQVATTERYYGQVEKSVEPQYDLKKVDRKITELQNFLYLADATIKQSNATTIADINMDMDELLSPLD